MVNLDINNFNESIRQAKAVLDEQKQKLKDLIDPFYDKSLSKKEVIELCNLGKFILKSNEQIKIIKKSESPDFLVKNKGEIVGVEIEGIFNSEKVQSVKSVQGLLEIAAFEFRKLHPEIKSLVNFQLDINFFVRQKEKQQRIEEINDYIFGVISNKTVIKPAYIESIHFMKHSRLDYYYLQGAYFVNSVNDKIIDEAVKKKERKFDSYIANSKTNRQWLLIVIDSGATESYTINENRLLKSVTSKFERIYVLEDFSNQLSRIK